MDAAGLLSIFQRSIKKHDARYVGFLGDRDTKAHKTLIEEEVYEEVPQEKHECVGNIQNRLDSSVRFLKKGLGKTPLPDGKSMKKEDSLTARLTNYKCTMGKQSGTIHMTLNP